MPTMPSDSSTLGNYSPNRFRFPSLLCLKVRFHRNISIVMSIHCILCLYVWSNREKALTMYIFSRNAKIQQAFLEETTCGSVCINDTIMQFTGENLR